MITELRLKILSQQARKPGESTAKFHSVQSLRMKAADGIPSSQKVNELKTEVKFSAKLE